MIDATNKICDFDKVIVDDSRTCLAGYLEITKTGVLEHTVSDPNNKELFDKVQYPDGSVEYTHPFKASINKLVIDLDPKLFIAKGVNSFHFCNADCLLKWLEQNHNRKEE